MCYDKDNDGSRSFQNLGTANTAKGACCKTDATDKLCDATSADSFQICSQPSLETDTQSSFTNILTQPGSRNHQLFAYCPSTTRGNCGLPVSGEAGAES